MAAAAKRVKTVVAGLADHYTDLSFVLGKSLLLKASESPSCTSSWLLLWPLGRDGVGICYHHTLFYSVSAD